MKEQIIIDGVDVKNCNFFLPSNKYCGLYSTGCKFVTECYYKQLVNKTQECEELKSQIDADYEYYSQQLKILRNIIENKEKRNARLFVISNNYRKALEEIEDFRKKHCDFYCEHNRILDIINKAKSENKQSKED